MHRPRLPVARLAAPFLLLSGVAGAAHAESDVNISGSIGAATDYVFRGVSQTNEDPFVFGTLDVTAGDFYGGIGAENVDFGNDIDLEYDAWVGWKPKAGDFTFDLGVVRYGYRNQPTGVDIDTVEYKVAVSHPVGKGGLGAAVLHTPDYFGSDGSGTYYEVNGSVPLNDQWSISGAVGRQDTSKTIDYSTWNVGVGYAPFKHVSFDVRYHDTDQHDLGDLFDSRLVGTVKVMF